jgi:hypothetical protein
MTDRPTENNVNLHETSGREQTAPPSVNGKKKLTVGYLDVIIIAVIVAVTTVLVYNRYFEQKVVMVDLTGYIKQERALFVKGKISKTEVSANLDRFQKFIDCQPKNVTVLLKDVVLAGGKEIRFPARNSADGRK